MQGVHFTILLGSPRSTKFNEIWQVRSGSNVITGPKFLMKQIGGLWSCDTPELPFSTGLLIIEQQCRHRRATLYNDTFKLQKLTTKIQAENGVTTIPGNSTSRL